MHGYINVDQNELSDREEKVYLAYYCGLCRKLREECGKKGRTILNRDITFLVILLSGLYEFEEVEEDFVCAFHPTRKSRQRVNTFSEYAAHLNIMLAYNDLVDPAKEERINSQKTIRAMFQKDYDRIVELCPRQVRAIEDYLERHSDCESRGEQNIDLVAGLRGEMMGELFAWRQDMWYTELSNMGFYMGKFLYLMEIYDRLDRDVRRNQYNPFQSLQKESGRDFETIVRQMMNSMVAECIRSFERLPILLHADILRNVLYSGVWARYEEIRSRRERNTKKRQKTR